MPAKSKSVTRKRSKSKCPKSITCKKYTNRGCVYSANGRKTTRSSLKKRGCSDKRLNGVSAAARKRVLRRGVSKGRKQAVRDTKNPQCIVTKAGTCSWYIRGKKTTRAALLAKGFSAAKLAEIKKRSRDSAVRKGVKVMSKKRTASRSPAKKAATKKRNASKSPKKASTKTASKTASKKKSSGKKRGNSKALALWRKIAQEQGYLLPGDNFKRLPKKGTAAYNKLKAAYDAAKKKAGL